MRKGLLISLIIIGSLVIIALVVSLIIVILFLIPPSKTGLQNDLRRNEELFVELVEFFKTSQYENLSVRLDTTYSDGRITAFSNDSLEGGFVIGEVMLDEDILYKFEYLFNNLNYRRVEKQSNYIEFHRWSNRQKSTGILYVFDGDRPINHETRIFTRLDELHLPNWFYYEDQHRATRR